METLTIEISLVRSGVGTVHVRFSTIQERRCSNGD
jgi:hypothetical protein